jgi:hypothetical protein
MQYAVGNTNDVKQHATLLIILATLLCLLGTPA